MDADCIGLSKDAQGQDKHSLCKGNEDLEPVEKEEPTHRGSNKPMGPEVMEPLGIVPFCGGKTKLCLGRQHLQKKKAN